MSSEGALAGDAARTAVGALREMLSALGNLQQLLRSRSIGPKALAPLLPDVVHGAGPLLERLDSFWPLLGQSPLGQCRHELQRGLEQAIDELRSTLGPATQRPLGAGARLKAEAAVARALRELGGSLALFELVTDLREPGVRNDGPVSERRWVDWVEALTLSRSGDQVQAPGCQLVQATVVVQAQPEPLPVGPRAALNLAAVMSSWVTERAQQTRPQLPLRLLFENGSPKGRLRVDRQAAEGHRIGLWVPPLLAATESCLRAVAETRELELTLEPNSIALAW
jgi:hypothetical protein